MLVGFNELIKYNLLSLTYKDVQRFLHACVVNFA